MKNTKKLIVNLAILGAFHTSLNLSAMEQQSIGPANISRESGIEEKDQETLTEQIYRLKIIYYDLNLKRQLQYRELSIEEYNNIQQFQQIIQKIIQTAEDMRLGLIPVDIQFINQRTEVILSAAPYFLD